MTCNHSNLEELEYYPTNNQDFFWCQDCGILFDETKELNRPQILDVENLNFECKHEEIKIVGKDSCFNSEVAWCKNCGAVRYEIEIEIEFCYHICHYWSNPRMLNNSQHIHYGILEEMLKEAKELAEELK